MSEEKSDLAKERIASLKDEVETKGMYIALALLFVADAAGVFAASIPAIIFVALFVVVVGIDAYT